MTDAVVAVLTPAVVELVVPVDANTEAVPIRIPPATRPIAALDKIASLTFPSAIKTTFLDGDRSPYWIFNLSMDTFSRIEIENDKKDKKSVTFCVTFPADWRFCQVRNRLHKSLYSELDPLPTGTSQQSRQPTVRLSSYQVRQMFGTPLLFSLIDRQCGVHDLLSELGLLHCKRTRF